MIGTERQPGDTSSGNAKDFRHAFVVRVHQLLFLGYQRLDNPASLSGEISKKRLFYLTCLYSGLD